VSPSVEPEVVLIGIGNSLRGDDAVGLHVAGHIRERQHPSLRVFESDGDGAALLELWNGKQTVIIVDAVSSGSPPGTVHRFDVTEHPLHGRMFRDSTHAFSLQHAVELSRVLQKLPKRLIVYGIEAKSFALGAELSQEVSAALPQAAARILRDVNAQLQGGPEGE